MGESESAGPTWHGEIKQIIRRCQVYLEGGAPFTFESYTAVRDLAGVALNSMESGSMPHGCDPIVEHFKTNG